MKTKLLFAAFLACIFTSLNADVNVVALLFLTMGSFWRYITLSSIVLGFIVELLIMRRAVLKESFKKVFGVVLLMNLVTASMGMIFFPGSPLSSPLRYILGESWFNQEPNIFLLGPISIIINVIVEGTIAALFFKKVNKIKLFSYVTVANILSVIIGLITFFARAWIY